MIVTQDFIDELFEEAPQVRPATREVNGQFDAGLAA